MYIRSRAVRKKGWPMTAINSGDNLRPPVAMTAQAQEETAKSWTMVVLLFFFMFINFADRAVLGLAAEPLMRDLGLTPRQFGMVGSAFFLFYTVFAVILGFVINRVQTRWMLFALALVWSAAQFPMMFTANFMILLLTRMLLGAGEGPAYPAAIHCAFKWFPDQKRTLPVSIIAQGSALGIIIAAPTLNWIIYAYGWQAAFGILALIGVIWAVIWLILAEEGPISTTVTASGDEISKVSYWKLIVNPTILSTWFCLFAAYWILSTLLVWFPSYLQTGLGISKGAVGLWTALPWVGGALMLFVVGWLSQRLTLAGYTSRFSRGMVVCAMGLTGAICLIALPFVESVALKLAIVCIGVILPNAIVPPSQAIVGELTPVPQRGAVLAIGNAIAGSAGAIAPFVAGSLVQSAQTPLQGYELAFLCCGLVAGASNLLGLIFINPEAEAARLTGRTSAPATA